MHRFGWHGAGLISAALVGTLACGGADEDDGVLSGNNNSSNTATGSGTTVTGSGTTVTSASSSTSSSSTGAGGTANTVTTNTATSGASTATGTGGSGTTSTTAASGTGGTVGIGGGGTVFDGGTVDLTQDEADEILDDACAGWNSEGESTPAVLQLVIDVSSSMSRQAPGGGGTKWDVTRDALIDAITGDQNGGGLPGSVSVGMLFYPNVDGVEFTAPEKPIDACVNIDAMVPAAPLGGPDSDHRNLIRNGIASVQLETSTPTNDAFTYALDNGILQTDQVGQKFMLLITDGAPTLMKNCSNPGDQNDLEVDPQPIVDEVVRAAENGIRTFLIGSPGSEPNREWMSMSAFLGGTAWPGCHLEGPNYCHMDMTEATDFSQALREGFATVLGAISPCTYSFAAPPDGQEIDENLINVVVNDGGQNKLIVRDDVGDCSQGWQLTSDDQILLCPETCSDVQIDPSISVNVTFGCASRNPTIR